MLLTVWRHWLKLDYWDEKEDIIGTTETVDLFELF